MNDNRHIDSRFQRLLADFDTNALENDRNAIYGLWPDCTLAYVNRGWFQFAALNGGNSKIASEWTLGRCVLDAMAGPLRPLFIDNYQRCLQWGRPWEHLYECSSADCFREFHVTNFPLGESEGLLVVNSLRRETVHSRSPCPPLDELYRDQYGLVTLCSHCRRVRRTGPELVWDWVPAWVANQPSDTSHGLCKPCLGFYHLGMRTEVGGFVESFKA